MDVKLNKMRGHEVDLSGLGQEPAVGCCEHGNDRDQQWVVHMVMIGTSGGLS
jgi:hypothetical protein